jgi:hypothetical protein
MTFLFLAHQQKLTVIIIVIPASIISQAEFLAEEAAMPFKCFAREHLGASDLVGRCPHSPCLSPLSKISIIVVRPSQIPTPVIAEHSWKLMILFCDSFSTSIF